MEQFHDFCTSLGRHTYHHSAYSDQSYTKLMLFCITYTVYRYKPLWQNSAKLVLKHDIRYIHTDIKSFSNILYKGFKINLAWYSDTNQPVACSPISADEFKHRWNMRKMSLSDLFLFSAAVFILPLEANQNANSFSVQIKCPSMLLCEEKSRSLIGRFFSLIYCLSNFNTSAMCCIF